MRATEIIRNILDIIDALDAPKNDVVVNVNLGDDPIKQVQDLLPTGEMTPYQNTPQERIAGIDAVTTDAGGGVNGPKHQDDLRGTTVKLYRGV